MLDKASQQCMNSHSFDIKHYPETTTNISEHLIPKNVIPVFYA
jgi:hypothetical protein